MFALMELMFRLAAPGPVYPDLLRWLHFHSARGELPPPLCIGMSFLSPFSQSPACHTHTGRTLPLADNGESWDKGHMEAGRENEKADLWAGSRNGGREKKCQRASSWSVAKGCRMRGRVGVKCISGLFLSGLLHINPIQS